MKKYKIGYTTGVYDLFHIGHLNIIKKAKEECDFLIVGVTSDEEAFKVKSKKPLIPFEERIEIVRSIIYVDMAISEDDTNKIEAWKNLKFQAIFKGDDWKNTPKWLNYEKEFIKLGVDVVYFPYTKTTSSTKIRKFLDEI